MNAEEQFDLDQAKLAQRVRDALLGLGEFGNDEDSKNILFFSTEMMLTCELDFEAISPEGYLRCSVSVGVRTMYSVVAHFCPQSDVEDFQQFSRDVFKAAVRAREEAAVANKLREIRRTLGMEN